MSIYDDRFDMDSFGSDCPANWEEICDYLNGIADECGDDEDARNSIWDNYFRAVWDKTLPEGAPYPSDEKFGE